MMAERDMQAIAGVGITTSMGLVALAHEPIAAGELPAIIGTVLLSVAATCLAGLAIGAFEGGDDRDAGGDMEKL